MPSCVGFCRVLLIVGVVHVAFSLRAGDPFSIVALPDTQYYSKYSQNSAFFTRQTQWIVDQIQGANPWNISFVSHLGDVVNDGNVVEQWERAHASMSVLGPHQGAFVVPFGILPGNHDFNATAQKQTGASFYSSYFGPQRFSGASWYGGADPSGLNSFQIFSAGGFEFLHLALEWAPNENIPERSPSPLEWASHVILAHPTMPVILSTHEYIDDKPAGRSATGDAIFEELVSSHDQIILVLCGHFHNLEDGVDSRALRNDGEWHQVSTNKFGRPVVEVLQDYQDYPNGGNGWLRLITFDLSAEVLKFETYSPVLDKYQLETIEDVGQYASKFSVPLSLTRLVNPIVPFGHRSSMLKSRQGVRQRFLTLKRHEST